MSLSLFLQPPGLCSQVWEVVTAPSVPCKSQILLLVLIPGKLWDMENIDLHNGLSDENTGILLKTTQTSGKDNSQRSGSFKRETRNGRVELSKFPAFYWEFTFHWDQWQGHSLVPKGQSYT